MVSLMGSMLFPSNIWIGSARPSRFIISGRRISIGSPSYGLSTTVCACMAPPPNLKASDGFSASKCNDSRDLENLNAVQELEDVSDVLIECKDVYKSFGEKHILRGLSFKIRHGEAVGIIGPSGTGKTTILKIMAGLLAPDKGEVFIRGRRRHGLISDEEISGLRIGLVFQSAALFDSLTVRENVGFLLYENSSMSEDQIAALVTETLAAVGLKGVEDRLPSELSGGMKKRVALARSIIFDTTKDLIEPEILLENMIWIHLPDIFMIKALSSKYLISISHNKLLYLRLRQQKSMKARVHFFTADLAVGPIRSLTMPCVINVDNTCNAFLGRTWLHRYGAIPSTYHQFCQRHLEQHDWVLQKLSKGSAFSPPLDQSNRHLLL